MCVVRVVVLCEFFFLLLVVHRLHRNALNRNPINVNGVLNGVITYVHVFVGDPSLWPLLRRLLLLLRAGSASIDRRRWRCHDVHCYQLT